METGAIIVFVLIGIALFLFVTEWIPNDITAIGVLTSLALLGNWTQISPREAISGFSSTATITIVAMYMLSAGIQKTGLVQYLGVYLGKIAAGKEWRGLLATVGSTGPIAGFINNTPVVAVFIPMISDLADRLRISPSRLLMPLSFAAILGGTLTLIGTSTNLLASELAAQLIEGRGPIGMFEFTKLGLLLLVVGILYIMTAGQWLTPARIPPRQDLVEEFEIRDRMMRVRVKAHSPLIDKHIDEFNAGQEKGPDMLQLKRGEDVFQAPYTDRAILEDDILTLLGAPDEMESFVDVNGLQRMPGRKMGEKLFEEEDGTVLAKFVVPPDSPFIGEMVTETHLHTHHQSNVLAIRRDEALQQEVEQVELEAGDTLLVQTPVEALSYFQESGELMLVDDSTETPETTEEVREEIPDLDPSTPAAICIMAGVIGLAALGLVPIVIAALGGVVAMVVSGCLSSQDAYRSVSWNIIFLLAGVIPLGLAMQKTGGDEVIGQVIATSGNFLPAVGVLFLLYLITGLLANVITPVATVVLMIPVAVDVAGTIGADEFSFLLGVMFASANSFMTPVGYQTNLMIYVPGGYTFTDFIKVGGPLQLLIALTSTAGIWWFWGV